MAIWPTRPIHNAADVTLDKQPGTLPNVADTLANFFQLLTVRQVTKTVVNFQLSETATTVQFQGALMPFPAQQLRMKPEGQRAWKWKKIFTWPSVTLNPDDIVLTQDGTQYRVMNKSDFKEYGYDEYDCTEDYTGSSPA